MVGVASLARHVDRNCVADACRRVCGATIVAIVLVGVWPNHIPFFACDCRHLIVEPVQDALMGGRTASWRGVGLGFLNLFLEPVVGVGDTRACQRKS